MILMVIVFLMLLFWENELNEHEPLLTLEHLYIDYPPDGAAGRYCNHLIQQRLIRERDHTCKRKHVFIHERPQKINSVCLSTKKAACLNQSSLICSQSETKFRLTVCELTAGTRYPACSYQSSATQGFILVVCDDLGPVTFEGYVE
ncbi:probable inactive ribonuclease-like protein 12 [Ochotona curzoniae]|uniref:probable inactive ribonuclease-like protein 12 n=1 Tax=Ochotona curzoniae TaxID=130825 RepID=UPI001B34B139|nr:probable inactive ribonuclease-like protein 12 [Ochotona curzoniae]